MRTFGKIFCAIMAPLAAAAGTLTDIGDIHAATNAPGTGVALRGVVTAVMYWRSTSFVLAGENDPNGPAVYVSGEREGVATVEADESKIEPGSIVSVQGEVWRGAFAPCVTATNVAVLGRMDLPDAKLARLRDLDWGCRDNERVRLRGVLVDAKPFSDFRGERTTGLRFMTPDGPFIAHTHGPTRDWSPLFDAELEVEGLAMSFFNNQSEFMGVQLEIVDESKTRALKKPPASPFDAPEVEIRRLFTYSPEPPSGHRVRTEGTVTYSSPAGFFYIQNEDNAVRAEVSNPSAVPSVGARVEVAGFPDRSAGVGKLANASVRIVAERAQSIEPLPLPQDKTLKMIFFENGEFQNCNGCLVSATGRLFRMERRDGRSILHLSIDGRILHVMTDGDIPGDIAEAIPDEPLVSITGICLIEIDGNLPEERVLEVRSVSILLRSPDDIAILPDAQWSARVRTRLLSRATYAALAAAIVLSFVLLAAGRRKRQRLEAVIAERRRIAGDLHDTLEQHFATAKMILGASANTTPDIPPRVKESMGMVAEIMAHAKSEVRSAVMNLRSDELMKRNFRDIVRDMAARISAGGTAKVRCSLAAVPDGLPVKISVELVAIVQEAVANAIKHGQAANIIISADAADKSFSLSVANDGKPFRVASATVPSAGNKTLRKFEFGHFGLVGMAERAKSIGAELSIAPRGKWTVVKVSNIRMKK